MTEALLFDIAVVVIAATLLAYIAKGLGQPLIPAYIIAGVLIGPYGPRLGPLDFSLVTDPETVATLSELGIAFLLFIVGMEINFRKLKSVQSYVLYGGMFQVVLTFALGYVAALILGFSASHAAYMGIILTFSSTMVVIKLLSDQNRMDTLPGRLMVGILLMQDLWAVIALSLVLAVGAGSVSGVMFVVLQGLGLVALALVFKKTLFPLLFGMIADSAELLFLAALSTCFLFIGLSQFIGFPLAIGAFIAGLSLTAYPYDLEIVGRVKSLRDFFATLFFVSLGMQIVLGSVMAMLAPIILLTFFVLIVKPFILFAITKSFGYETRTSFISSISLAQISEFSLIVVMVGVTAGALPIEFITLTALIAITTITASSYFIQYTNKFFDYFSRYLLVFEAIGKKELKEGAEKKEYLKNHAVIIGADVMGKGILGELQNAREEVTVLDYNPEIVNGLLERGVRAVYGDVRHVEVLERLHMKAAAVVFSTIHELDDSLFLLNEVKKVNPGATILLSANSMEDALMLYDKGADYVIIPEFLGRQKVRSFVSALYSTARKDNMSSRVHGLRDEHIRSLERAMEKKILEEHEPLYMKHLRQIVKYAGGKKSHGSRRRVRGR